VGIGNSTKAEKEFLKLYPKCNLYGVEIAPSNVDDFGTFGKIINAGIGMLCFYTIFALLIIHTLGFDGKQKIVDSHNYGNQISYNVTVKPLDMVGIRRKNIEAALPVSNFRFWIKRWAAELFTMPQLTLKDLNTKCWLVLRILANTMQMALSYARYNMINNIVNLTVLTRRLLLNYQ
jgi:hypothetical protein